MPIAASSDSPERTAGQSKAAPGWWLLLLGSVAIAVHGISFQFRGIDAFALQLLASFYERPWAIWLHMLFGSVALVTGALNFRHTIRRRWPLVHRKLGELYVLACLLTGGAGAWLAVFAYGGLSNRLGFAGLAIATLTTTAMAYWHAQRRDFAAHRAWMIRSFAMIFGAVTLRIQLPLLAIYFQGFDPAYAIVAWSCWVPNLLFAEWVVRRWRVPAI